MTYTLVIRVLYEILGKNVGYKQPRSIVILYCVVVGRTGLMEANECFFYVCFGLGSPAAVMKPSFKLEMSMFMSVESV